MRLNCNAKSLLECGQTATRWQTVARGFANFVKMKGRNNHQFILGLNLSPLNYSNAESKPA